MPGMVAFGRRWSVATDDFTVIGLIDSIFFLCWWCWSVVVYTFYRKAEKCTCNLNQWCVLLQVFLAGSCCLYLLNWMLATSFIIFSTRGTVSDPKPRRHVVTLVYVKCFLSLLDLAWAILGSILIGQSYSCQDFNAESTIKIITACLWFMFLVRLFMIWMFYDPRGRKLTPFQKVINNEYFTYPAPSGTARKWRHRLQAFCFWCTFPSKDKAIAINTISQLFAFLVHDLDIVTSDLIAAIILFKQDCFAKFKITEAEIDVMPPITLQDGSPADRFPTSEFLHWMNLKLASHYFNISLGIFGWPWTLYRNFSCGLCSLWKYLNCCFCCRKSSIFVKGDNCCACNLAGLQVASGYKYEDLVYVSFVNRIYRIPFFVAIDEPTSSIIISLRGSMSCADAITDIAASFSPLDDEGLSKDALCHGGMLVAARRVKSKLEDREILKNVFQGREDYTLILTGHSLGAGVSSILTLLLRKPYPNIRCYAFTPPPVLNAVALKETKNIIFTVIFGNDIVPFLNYHNVRDTIMRSVSLFNKCKLPKYKILLGKFNLEEKKKNYDATSAVSINDSTNLESGAIDNQKENGINEEGGDSQINILPVDPRTRLFVPGRILHIKYSKSGYRLHVCNAEDFYPISFCPNMIYHHFPQFMQICLEQFADAEVVELKSM